MTHLHPATPRQRLYVSPAHFARGCVAALGFACFASGALAADKPPLSPDTATPFTTTSRISATIEFGLPALASAIEEDIPRRLATIDERISCVHRRVLVFRVNANCDVSGFVERSGPVSLYGRGDHVYGSVPIYGAIEGQGANRFTARIHGETEASATIEAEARPQLRRDWSLDLNFSDGFHWSEPPILHVLGRDIPLAKYAEPRIRTQLAHVRSRALAAARRLDLHDKAATAWQHAFEPIKLADDPQIWLQLTPQNAAFAGVRANAKVLSGSLELSGSAETVVGQAPPAVTPTTLPPLGTDVAAPGTFDVILPVRINYDTLRDKIMQVVGAAKGENVIREVQVYPSAGKLVIGLRVAKASEADPTAGEWVYLSGALNVDTDKQTVQLSDLAVQGTPASDIGAMLGNNALLEQLKEQANVSYGVAYQNLLNAANERLTRPLKNGYRMEGHLTSAKLDKVWLLADGLSIALRASGELKILYGL
ncbi:DUF4403 family protein [Bradyrhizobium canariense]|uniref:DUF4403 domain-containing protein n=1 Tax=Bradyrhizobium canariense TaxID=255045 RepID=A0A1H1WMZ9_9BRAD|nr:DUF4403 family protein [Bradyrhizobium canariense]SDS97981.1 protein of unknown function [Bradyrhizobium canariense]